MRALRDSLTAARIAALVLACAGLLCVRGVLADRTSGAPTAAGGNRMYPLAVGNSWTYRCTAEGSDAFEKTVKLTKIVEQDGKRFYRAEMRIKRDPKPLVYFLATGRQGEVFSVFNIGDATREVLITPSPKTGDRIGERVAAVGEKMRVPALGQVEVVRTENSPRDDPKLSEDQRMEWSGRYYALGVGLVAEADGLGGECALTRYKLVGH